MIESSLEFEFNPDVLKNIVSTLCSLPDSLRPTHYSLGEGEAQYRIVSTAALLSELSDELGPFLRADGIVYDLLVAGTKPIICNCFLEIEPKDAIIFIERMAALSPTFGFACAPEERERRNRVVVKQGPNTIESWVGRDPAKYIPGLYWLTLIPRALAEKHDVAIKNLCEAAQENTVLSGDYHLLQFYKTPEDWLGDDPVAQLCASMPGIFDISRVLSELNGDENYAELSDILNRWK